MVLLLAILLAVFLPISEAWSVALIVAGCALEVVEVAALRKWSKRLDKKTKPTTGAESLIGESAKVVEACRPTGMVQLRGELWEARCEEGAALGETVRVESLDGLTLVVAR